MEIAGAAVTAGAGAAGAAGAAEETEGAVALTARGGATVEAAGEELAATTGAGAPIAGAANGGTVWDRAGSRCSVESTHPEHVACPVGTPEHMNEPWPLTQLLLVGEMWLKLMVQV